MRFEDTIQWKYDFYPDLYQERFECLNHVFFTIGNGQEWKKGELISPEYNKSYIAQLDETGRAVQRKESELHRKVKNFSKTHPHLQSSKWYPFCGYSKIFNLPKNIKKDWEDGAMEIIKLYQDDGNTFKLNEKLSLKIKKERKYNYYIVMICDSYKKMFFDHDLIVSLLLRLTWEQYKEKGLRYNGFIDENKQLYFNSKRDVQKMLDDLESYLVINRLTGG